MPHVFKYILFIILTGQSAVGFAQISFGAYTSEGITIDLSANPVLDFGGFMPNESRTINLTDTDVAVIPITGVEFLDIVVTITTPDFLENNGDQIPVTINTAYANRGADNVSDAITFTDSAIFRIKHRDIGPPRPPPTPEYDNYEPPMATAYLYIYGSINVGTVSSGVYTGEITIFVEYD